MAIWLSFVSLSACGSLSFNNKQPLYTPQKQMCSICHSLEKLPNNGENKTQKKKASAQ
jgi:hypothetical protein